MSRDGIGLRAVERLADARFAHAHRAAVYDASRVLLHGKGVAHARGDRERALSTIEQQLRAQLLPASRSEPPSRMAHCFCTARDEWVVVMEHVCDRTLRRRPEGDNDGPDERSVTDAEVTCGLGILTLLYLLHPPTVEWISMETSLTSILLAEGSDHKRMLRKRQHGRQLRLAMVDCVLGFCVARARARTYHHRDAQSNRLSDPLRAALSQAFASMAGRCSYQLDHEAVFSAAHQAKQRDNIQVCLDALDALKSALHRE